MVCVVGCEVVNLGGRLAVIRGWVREIDAAWVHAKQASAKVSVEEVLGKCKGNLLAVCEHGKVNTDPPIQGKERSVKL